MTITFKFGTQTETCKKQLQDISLYSQKCADYCLSNNCPDLTPYYKDPFASRCVDDCQDGYTESGTTCIPLEMCHSTCGTCTVKNDPNQCTSCSSTFTSLTYTPFATGATVGSCAVTATSNAQLLLTVNKNTVLGTSELKEVNFNGAIHSTSGIALSSLTALYSTNVIEFMSLSVNTVTFTFGGLPAIHKKLIIRARVLTECAAENKTIKLTLTGDNTPTVVSFPLTSLA
jgi:hypothetical protein